jgi:hypothetical protein
MSQYPRYTVLRTNGAVAELHILREDLHGSPYIYVPRVYDRSEAFTIARALAGPSGIVEYKEGNL